MFEIIEPETENPIEAAQFFLANGKHCHHSPAKIREIVKGLLALAPKPVKPLAGEVLPCPYIVTGDEGTSYCRLAEKEVSHD